VKLRAGLGGAGVKLRAGAGGAAGVKLRAEVGGGAERTGGGSVAPGVGIRVAPTSMRGIGAGRETLSPLAVMGGTGLGAGGGVTRAVGGTRGAEAPGRTAAPVDGVAPGAGLGGTVPTLVRVPGTGGRAAVTLGGTLTGPTVGRDAGGEVAPVAVPAGGCGAGSFTIGFGWPVRAPVVRVAKALRSKSARC
jgi:hypothetical protein